MLKITFGTAISLDSKSNNSLIRVGSMPLMFSWEYLARININFLYFPSKSLLKNSSPLPNKNSVCFGNFPNA